MQGKWNEAAQAFEKALWVYLENTKLEEGYGVELFRKEILHCRAKASG